MINLELTLFLREELEYQKTPSYERCWKIYESYLTVDGVFALNVVYSIFEVLYRSVESTPRSTKYKITLHFFRISRFPKNPTKRQLHTSKSSKQSSENIQVQNFFEYEIISSNLF